MNKPQTLTCAACGKKEHFPSKSRSRKCGWVYGKSGRYCPACANDALAAEWEAGREEREAREQKEYEKWMREVDEKEAWPGNRRIARWIEARLIKVSVHFKRNNTLGGSIYFELRDANDDYCGDLRVADHCSPCGGGYNVEKQDRSYGDADIDCNPHSEIDWEAAVAKAVELCK